MSAGGDEGRAEPAAAPPAPPPGPAFDAPAEARRLLRTVRAGALATLSADGPFASLVAVATRPDGAPILLVSRLAAHTRQLEADPRCSLLLPEGGKGDPLAHPRLTLVGRAVRAECEARLALRDRFLRRNPKSELYADFPDFSFWHVEPQMLHLNGGFARAASFRWDEIVTRLEGAESLLAAEAEAVAHMNADHAEALALYARVRGGATGGQWRLSGLDPDGLDLVSGDRVLRLPFESRIETPAELRRHLVAWAAEARAAG